MRAKVADDEVPEGIAGIKKGIDAVAKLLEVNFLWNAEAEFRRTMGDNFDLYCEVVPCGRKYCLCPGVKEIFHKISLAAAKPGGGPEVYAALRELRTFDRRRYQN